MPLTPQPQHITVQLSQVIKEMRYFLLNNPMVTNSSDVEKYKNLYIQISKLSVQTLAEGYVGYEHSNPYKTLTEFLNAGEINKQILKYYWEPIFKKYISLSDSIKVSDEVFVKIIDDPQYDIQWGASELALIGIIFTLVVGLVPLLNIFLDNFLLSSILAFVITVLLMVLLTKVKFIKRRVVSSFRWFLK